MRQAVSVLLLILIAALPALAQSLPERSDRIVDYRISVALDPAKRQLTGKQTLTWRNPSTTDMVQELQFHLYLNAFKNTKSTFVKESGGQLRGDEMTKDGWGWIDVTSLRTSTGADLKPTLAFIQPDDGNKDDQTRGEGDAAGARAAGRDGDARDGLHVEAAAGVRANGVQGRFLSCRPVVSEARCLRAGGHARAGDWRLELPPVPREFGVLRGLRQLRGRHHRPERLCPRRHGRTEGRARERQRHDHVHVRAGRHSRLRVDRGPGLRRCQGDVLGEPGRHPRGVRAHRETARADAGRGEAVRCRHHGAAAARSSATGPAPYRRGEGGAEVLRASVRSLSLQDPDRGGPRTGSGRRRRHGVPDAHHGGLGVAVQLLAVRQDPQRRDGDRPRVRPPVLVRDGREQRVRGSVARRGLQHLVHEQGDGGGLRRRRYHGGVSRTPDRRPRRRPREQQPRGPV